MPAVDRLQVGTIFLPTLQHLLVRCAVHTLSGHFRLPAAQLAVEVRQITRLAHQQPAQKISPYVNLEAET